MLALVEKFSLVKWFQLKRVTIKFCLKFDERIETKSATIEYGKSKKGIRISEDIGSKIPIAIQWQMVDIKFRKQQLLPYCSSTKLLKNNQSFDFVSILTQIVLYPT